jgi:hypothetical protein
MATPTTRISASAALALAVLAAAAGASDETTRGSREVYVSGGVQSSGTASLVVRYGQAVKDGLEAGVLAGAGGTPASSWYLAGLFAEYSLDLGSRFVPFVGASFDHRSTYGRKVYAKTPSAAATVPPPPDGIWRHAIGAGAEAGLKWFVARNLALSAAVHADVPGDKNTRLRPDMTNWSVALGTRFFF